MAPLWYYRLFGTEFGPIDHAKLVELHQGGTLGDTDEVRAADATRWLTYQQAFAPAPTDTTTTAVMQPSSSDSPDDELNWYYLTLGHDLGPVSFNELRQLAEQGSLTAEDEIKFGADGKYRRVGSMGKLAAYLPYVAPVKQSSEKPAGKRSDPVIAQVATQPAAAAAVEAPAASVIQYHPSAHEPTWFAYIRGVEYGPSSLVQLSQLFQAGQIAATDFVKYGAYGQWMAPYPTIEQMLAQSIVATPAPVKAAAPVADTAPVAAAVAKPVNVPAVAVTKATTPVTVPVVQTAAEKAAPAPVAKPSVVEESVPTSEPAPQPQPVTAAVVASEPAPVQPAATMMPSSTSPPAWSAPATPARPIAKPATKSGGGLSFDLSALTSDPKMLGGVGLIAAVGLVLAFMFLMPASTSGERAKLEQLQKVYTEFKQLREKQAPANEWEQFVKTSAAIVDPIALELKDSASRQYPARQCLLWAARDRFKEMVQNAREKPTPQEEEFDYNLKKAANYLGMGPDPDLERATAAAQ